MADEDRTPSLESENRELRARVWLLENDLKALPDLVRENRNLQNLYNAARAEIARLTQPKAAHRPRKNVTGSYETYLYKVAAQLVVEALSRRAKLTEKCAAIQADKLIRADAKKLQNLGIAGPFSGLAAAYQADDDSVYKAFRRGKRAAGMTKQNGQTNK